MQFFFLTTSILIRVAFEPTSLRELLVRSSRSTTPSKFCFVFSLTTFNFCKTGVIIRQNQLIDCFSRMTLDFDTNKKICEEVASIPSKRVRNKIAGFVTHLMKRLKRGPVRGISLKLQEEERERRMDSIPDKSCLDLPKIEVKGFEDVQKMLASINFPQIADLVPLAEKNNKPRYNNKEKKDPFN
jgi:small subunit ribosomal protein S17e